MATVIGRIRKKETKTKTGKTKTDKE